MIPKTRQVEIIENAERAAFVLALHDAAIENPEGFKKLKLLTDIEIAEAKQDIEIAKRVGLEFRSPEDILADFFAAIASRN